LNRVLSQLPANCAIFLTPSRELWLTAVNDILAFHCAIEHRPDSRHVKIVCAQAAKNERKGSCPYVSLTRSRCEIYPSGVFERASERLCSLSLSASFSPCRIYIVVYIFVSGMKVCAVKSHCRQQLKANKKPTQRRGSATRRILYLQIKTQTIYTRWAVFPCLWSALSLSLSRSQTRDLASICMRRALRELSSFALSQVKHIYK
jgi:hypothetical protein